MDRRQEAERFGIPVKEDLSAYPFVRDKVSIVPYLFSKQKRVLPLERRADGIVAAVADPLDLDAIEEARLLLKEAIHPVYCPLPQLERAIEQCYHQKEAETRQLIQKIDPSSSQEEGEEGITGYDLLAQKDENPVVQLVNALFLEAIQQHASDIHLEPTEEGLTVRYRIDGLLQKRHSPPQEIRSQLLARIKVMANLDIAEHRLPQDGRIKLQHGSREIDFRVSTLPTVHGERIVLRILDRGNLQLGLGQLGMPPSLLKMLRRILHAPEGIVLVTGPTGSGKTTTLYSGLMELDKEQLNILTIEDPVEYKLPGICQMSVNPKIGLTFARGLRHILRQDPDVLLIGEIRDRETAEIAIQSSLTGHLVLSTLHTNDAPSALARLADMGIEPYLLSSSILAILAQRLVRLLCPLCKEKVLPNRQEWEELHLPGDPQPIYYPVGCPSCFGTGYKGRRGIYELLPITETIREQIGAGVETAKIRRLAEGMETLASYGMRLVLEGVTSSAEILRVTHISGEMG
jgi:general secretion pathway protein E